MSFDKTAWASNRRRMLAYGRWEPTQHVDPTKARNKILELRAEGLSNLTIGKSTGVAEHVIGYIGHGSRQWIHPDTERRILGFKSIALDALDDRARIDSTGTLRRIQAMVAIGWSFTDLAERLGCTPRNVSHIAGSGKKFTQASTVRAIAALYAELWDQPALDGSRRVRALKLASRNGWAPPLAWDDDTIDDPNATPNLGAPTKRTNGGPGRPTAHVVEDIEWFLELSNDVTATEIAQRLGYADATGVQNALKQDRGNRPDLLARLARNAEVAA